MQSLDVAEWEDVGAYIHSRPVVEAHVGVSLVDARSADETRRRDDFDDARAAQGAWNRVSRARIFRRAAITTAASSTRRSITTASCPRSDGRDGTTGHRPKRASCIVRYMKEMSARSGQIRNSCRS